MNTIQLDATPRAVDMIGDKIIVGCRDGNIIEIDGANKKIVMQSHSDGEVWGLDTHPTQPNVIVSSGDDNKLKSWDAARRCCTDSAVLER